MLGGGVKEGPTLPVFSRKRPVFICNQTRDSTEDADKGTLHK